MTVHEPQTIHYLPDCTHRQFEEVLAALARWSARNAPHVTHLREAERPDYHGVVVAARLLPAARAAGQAPAIDAVFRLVARNVSRRGIGLIAPPQYVPQVLSVRTPVLKTGRVFQPPAILALALPRRSQPQLVVRAQIVRLRPIVHSFFEIGARFTGREETDDDAWKRLQQLLSDSA